MATERITDQKIIEAVSTDASVLVIQDDGTGKEVLYETTLENFIKALKESGITDDCMKTEDYKDENNSLIQEVVVSKEKISVKYLNGETVEYTAETFPEINSVENTFGIFLEKIEKGEGDNIVSSGARITFDNFVKSLKESELLNDVQKASEFEELKPDIIKRVSVSSEKIVVEKLDGTSIEYTADIFPLVDVVSTNNTVFVTKTEKIGGKTVTSGARITFDNFIKALKDGGLLNDVQKASEFEELKPDIIKRVTVSSEKIVVEKLDGTSTEYTADIFPLVDAMAEDNEVFFSKKETKQGKSVLSGKRITLKNLVTALKAVGINSGLMTTEDFTKQKSNIVKSVTLTNNVISVLFLNNTKREYTIDTAFFDHATVDEDGYLHISKNNEEVIAPILIPALRKNIAEITCRNVGYVFEEET